MHIRDQDLSLPSRALLRLHSDNGKNFVGANREERLIDVFELENIQGELYSRGIEWTAQRTQLKGSLGKDGAVCQESATPHSRGGGTQAPRIGKFPDQS